MPVNPIDSFVNGLASGSNAAATRRQIKEDNRNTNPFSGLRPRPVPSFGATVFRGFAESRFTPETRMRLEQMQFQREAFELDAAIKQRAANDEREALRGVAALSDQIAALDSPEEKLALLNRNAPLAARVPGVFAEIRKGVDAELRVRKEAQAEERALREEALAEKKHDEALRQESLTGRINEGVMSAFESLAETNPILAARLSADYQSGDVARQQSALEQLGEAGRTFQGPFGDALHNLQLARDLGDPDQIAAATAALNKVAAPSGFVFEQKSDGSIILQQGSSGLTTGTTSDIQKSIATTTSVLTMAHALQESLSLPQAQRSIGFRGLLTKVRNTLGAQINPNLFDAEPAAIRKQMLAFRETALRIISADSRFSNADFDRLNAIFPSDGAFESVQDAQAGLNAVIGLMESRIGTLEGILDNGVGGGDDDEFETVTLPSGTTVRLPK